MAIVAALLAGSTSSSVLNAVIGTSIQRGDTAMNDGGWLIFVQLWTNGDPSGVEGYRQEDAPAKYIIECRRAFEVQI